MTRVYTGDLADVERVSSERITSFRMRNYGRFFWLVALVFLTTCSSGHPAKARPVTLGIFEVVDCKTSSRAPMNLKGSAEKYCLAAKPLADETDVRLARASRDESGKPQLLLLFTLKTGQLMREVTERIYTEHRRRNDQGRMGIVIDGTLINVPELSGVISDSLVIDGGFSWEDAVRISESMNAKVPQSW